MLKFYRSVLAAGVVALGLAACGDNGTTVTTTTTTHVVHQVTVIPSSATINVSQAVVFVAQVNADSGLATTVTWVSSNPAIATVSSAGLVTGIAPGTTTIVATSTADPTKIGAGSVTVNNSGFTFSVSPTNATLGLGNTLQATTQLQAGVTATVAWQSSNTAVATVSSAGLVTAVSAGSAIITATATATAGASGSASATMGLTVVATAPPGVIAFTVSPPTMNLAPGQSSQATATQTLAPGFTALPVTWTSLTPAIATVSNTGLITGVAQGSAVVTATITGGGVTLTGSVAVNVGAAASISINAINGGSTAGTVVGCAGVAGLPVVITNVNCQIDVVLNLNAGIQPIDSVSVILTQGAHVFRAFSQRYNNSIPAAGPVTLSVNTANFTKVPATGVATVDLFNGPTTVTAQVWPHVGAGGSVVNCQIGGGNPDPTCSNLTMVLTNTDGWTADIGKCETANTFPGPTCSAAVPAIGAAGTNASTGGFANDVGGAGANVGNTYWGGPTNSGMTVLEIYPVIYNDNPGFPSGSSQNRCSNTLGNGTGCISTVTFTLGSPAVGGGGNCGFAPAASATQTVQPFVERFGSGTGTAINACAAYQNTTAIRDNAIITAAIDGVNNPFTLVGTANGCVPAGCNPNFTLIANTSVTGATPDSARYDYQAPSAVTAPQVQGAENFNWVNQNWIFKPGGTIVTDGGVGPSAASWTAFATANGAPLSGSPAANTFPTTIVNGAGPLAETNVNCVIATCGASADGYLAKAWAADRLGNFAGSSITASFGEDRTAPMVRYSDPAAPSSFATIYTGGGAGLAATYMDSTTYDAFEGIYGANVVTAGAQTLFIGTAPNVSTSNDSVRIEALDNRSGLSRFVEFTNKFAQGGATGTTTSMYSTTTGAIGPATIDGWLPAPALNVINGRANAPGTPPVVGTSSVTAGYYTTTEYVIDKAGNVSGCPVITAAAGGNPAGTILGTTGFIASICPAGNPATTVPSFTNGTNLAIQAGPGANQNEFVRRTLALDPAQPAVTGISPNAAYTGNSPQTFILGAQDDLEVIDQRLKIVYPNVTQGDAGATASPGLVWSYALSGTFMGTSPNGNTGTGPSSAFPLGIPANTTAPFGYFAPAGIRFDASIINPVLTGTGGVPAMTLDQFTLAAQETCLGSASPAALCSAASSTTGHNGDPEDKVATTKPTNVGVTVRDVFGSWIFNTTASATTGVSTELLTAILSATVTAGTNFGVTYFNAGATTSCPQGGVAQPVNTTSCVSVGVNFRAEPSLSTPGSVEVFRSTEPLSTSLPLWTRVELYGLNAAGEWVFIQRCTVPAAIVPNTGAQACGTGNTVTGTDNGNERYWIYSFSGVTGGFTKFRALGVNSTGSALFSTIQP